MEHFPASQVGDSTRESILCFSLVCFCLILSLCLLDFGIEPSVFWVTWVNLGNLFIACKDRLVFVLGVFIYLSLFLSSSLEKAKQSCRCRVVSVLEICASLNSVTQSWRFLKLIRHMKDMYFRDDVALLLRLVTYQHYFLVLCPQRFL